MPSGTKSFGTTIQGHYDVLKKKIIPFLPRIFMSIAVVGFSYLIAQLSYNHITKVEIDKGAASNGKIIFKTIGDITFFSILGLGIILTLVNLGVELSSLFVVLGSVGLAIALALQDTISNVSAGFMILILNYYDLGDLIEIDDKMGVVDKFDLFTTSIKNNEGVIIKFPNNLITKGVLKNYYKSEELSLKFDVTISNNEKNTNYDDLFTKIKDELKNKIDFATNKENIKVSISDISASGTKIGISIPLKPQDYSKGKAPAMKVVRDVILANNLLLLDNGYIDVKKSDSASNSTSIPK